MCQLLDLQGCCNILDGGSQLSPFSISLSLDLGAKYSILFSTQVLKFVG